MDSSPHSLTALQRELIHSWFRFSADYFITGGTALVGYYGAPRNTDDVDLFTTSSETYLLARHTLDAVCGELGARAEAIVTAPSFQRYRVTRGTEATVVDLVFDLAPQIYEEKRVMSDGARVDPPEEILINKICTVVGRSEPRDYLDVYFLTEMGLDFDDALRRASLKDGGVDAEALVFVLGGVAWDRFEIPGAEAAVTRAVAAFFQSVAEKLALRVFPESAD